MQWVLGLALILSLLAFPIPIIGRYTLNFATVVSFMLVIGLLVCGVCYLLNFEREHVYFRSGIFLILIGWLGVSFLFTFLWAHFFIWPLAL